MVKVGGVDQAAQNGLAHSYLEERTSFLYMHISNTVNVQKLDVWFRNQSKKQLAFGMFGFGRPVVSIYIF